jgi:hypothetical protein
LKRLNAFKDILKQNNELGNFTVTEGPFTTRAATYPGVAQLIALRK